MTTDLTNTVFLEKNYDDDLKIIITFLAWNHIFCSKKSVLSFSKINTL